MLDIDLSRPARSRTERAEIVEAVARAPVHEPETDWIEWKSQLDLRRTDDQFKVARTILGFGNRDPDHASRCARGCAYFLIGVEPGGVRGIEPPDLADVEQWLGRFVARGEPQWSVDLIDVRERTVIFITVEAPEWGSSIFTLQRDFANAKAGSIFVRLNGKTDLASPHDVVRLTNRARPASTRIGISLELNSDVVLRPVAISEREVEMWVDEELARLPMPTAQRSDPFDIGRLYNTERRSEAEFRQQRARYEELAPRRYELLAFKEAVENEIAPLRLVVENHTDRNFPQTQAVIRLPADALAYFGTGEIEAQLENCRPPRPWGTETITSFLSPTTYIPSILDQLRPDGRSIEHAQDCVTVKLPLMDIRPLSRHELEPVFLVLRHPTPAATIEIPWTATSTGADGAVSGAVIAEVGEAVQGTRLVELALRRS